MRTLRSFEKNAQERKNLAFFWQECLPNPAQCLFFKEQPWANRSGPSEQKSSHEWLAPIALIRSWQKSDGSDLLFLTSKSLFGSQKSSKSLE